MFEGGWMVPMGQEDALREFLQVYRRLPRQSFAATDADRRRWQPLQIRSYATADTSYLYVVNDSPWYVGAAVKLDAPASAHFESLDARPQQAVRQEPAGALWNLTLAPYDLVAVRADHPGVKVADVVINLPPDVKPALENQIRALGVRAARLGNPSPLPEPTNHNFEQWEASPALPASWTVRGRRDVVSLESAHPHEGKSALRIQLPNGSISLRSAPIAVTDSGRLSVSIWARVADPNQQPRVRLVLEVDGSVYQPWSPIGVGSAERSMGRQWKEFVFRVSQLPPVKESLRIGVEIAGTGDVYLDDMQLYDVLVLDTAEHMALTHLLTGADFLRRKGMVSDCLHILDGYWPQYLLANVPNVAPQIADQPEDNGPQPDAEPATREASAFERLKRWMPR
jgi:hypothetical protein